MVMLMVLGIVDMLVALQLLWPFLPADWVFYLGMFMLFKGSSSILGGIITGFIFDIPGWLDLVVGIVLIFGFGIPFLWIFLGLKGLYSFVIGLGSFAS